MKFAILDPRPIPAATEANEKIFKTACGVCEHASGQVDGLTCTSCGGTGFMLVIGVEVTIPALAAHCAINIDPQHTEGNKNLAAIEVASKMIVWENCGEHIVATIRPDLDSVGSMAILKLASEGKHFSEGFLGRVAQIASADKFARGGWSGPKSLPTANNPWDENSASAESSRPLAAIAAAVADFRVPIADRVATMEKWLLTGEEPANYRAQVERERHEMIVALESGAIKYGTRCDGRIAVVESAHRAATSVGYSLAPVVVALNPAFRIGGGEPHRKFTICAFEARFADIKSALAELAALEPGWGGSPTIGGSPQGVSSKLTIDQVVEVLSRHLK